MKKINYPLYKKLIWRYLRVFVDAFIAGLAIDQLVLGTQDIRISVLKAGVAAGLAAIAKMLREGKPYTDKIHKVIL